MAAVPQRQCSICLEPAAAAAQPANAPPGPGEVAYACTSTVCQTVYCSGCLRELFVHAASNPALHPLRCCGESSLVNEATLALLDEKTKKALVLRCAEWQSSTRLYCPEPTCSTFIPEADAAHGTASCPSCRTRVCCHCRGRAHDNDDGQPCRRANVHCDTSVMDVLEEQGYRLCPRCQTGVEHMPGGCLEVECLACGHIFCFRCRGDVDICACKKNGIDESEDSGDEMDIDEEEDDDDACRDLQVSWQLADVPIVPPDTHAITLSQEDMQFCFSL